MAPYYTQRASAGLIISEATNVTADGVGYGCTPGLYEARHVTAWRNVTDSVHSAGGRIFAQLWHVGRVSHPSFLNGKLPVSASAIAPSGQCFTATGPQPYVVPHALTIEEIKQTIVYYRAAAQNALEAGFDGVEIHGANGYLPDQFQRDGSNVRSDIYGGSVENRFRFTSEVLAALIEVWGSERVGIRLSPCGTFNDMHDSDPRKHFSYFVQQLDKLKLAYLHIMEGMEGDIRHGGDLIPADFFRPLTKTPIITNAGFTKEKAEGYIAEDRADAVAWGTLFIANPDLPERFRQNAELNTADPKTFYAGGERGYLDYPVL